MLMQFLRTFVSPGDNVFALHVQEPSATFDLNTFLINEDTLPPMSAAIFGDSAVVAASHDPKKHVDLVLVNGKFCKNPSLYTPDDFSFSGFDVPGDTSNQLGVHVNISPVSNNRVSLSHKSWSDKEELWSNKDDYTHRDIKGNVVGDKDFLGVTNSYNNNLFFPYFVQQPRMYKFIYSFSVIVEKYRVRNNIQTFLYSNSIFPLNPDHRLFAKILKPGDLIVFPFGLVHFQLNIGKTSAVAIAALTSQNPGVNTIANNAIFGASPSINPVVITTAFHLDKQLVEDLQTQE
ncbi:hypothetical protein POTOM_017871 [Populus tomentosa]|uniref:Cupin type-1 domain-containing protein n=1 Tax=Populus tomentosa TaxID=118781 RepID=A0A8X8CW42_POPTO|nr:hypothetical protein POTOM_017871 [Populus tomentosa]